MNSFYGWGDGIFICEIKKHKKYKNHGGEKKSSAQVCRDLPHSYLLFVFW